MAKGLQPFRYIDEFLVSRWLTVPALHDAQISKRIASEQQIAPPPEGSVSPPSYALVRIH